MSLNVYVGTYSKYTQGIIRGVWAHLPDFEDKEDFLQFCREVHKDEDDPELMFQSWEREGVPEGMITEHFIDQELWVYFTLDEWEQEAVRVYRKEVEPSGSIDSILGAYRGKFDSVEDWASEALISSGIFANVPEVLELYFDWKAYARDAALGAHVAEYEGFVYIFDY